MPITANSPKVVAAKSEVTYDTYYMVFFQLLSPDPNSSTNHRVEAHLRLGRIVNTETGQWELDPTEPLVKVVVPNIFVLATQNTDVAQAMGALLNAVEVKARADQLIR